MSSSQPRILIVFGTRPEVIKLWPVDGALRGPAGWEVTLCNSGQHRELVPPLLATFNMAPEIELEVMRPGQSLSSLLARLLDGLDPVLAARRFDWVLVQGDTTTALAGALAAYHRNVPVAHLEAGLRTHDLLRPFPEEGNRQLISRVASLHLAPTTTARDLLLREGVPAERIEVTGNTVIDAARAMAGLLPADGSPPPGGPPALQRLGGGRALVLVTGHRRESFGGGLAAICEGLATLARSHPEADFVYPVHLNPSVQSAVRGALGGLANVHLLSPLDYPQAIWLLRRCLFVITDSGGLQEEAPEFGKPVLVTRASTERTEGVAAGCAELVGYDRERLVAAAEKLLRDPAAAQRTIANPYGDGRAAERTAAALRRGLDVSARRAAESPL